MSNVDLFFQWCRGQLPQGEVTLRLFTALDDSGDIFPVSFTEASFAGYRPGPDQIWVSRRTNVAVAVAFSCLLNYVTNALSSGQVVLGWYAVLTNENVPYLMGYQRFESPADMTSPGSSKSFFALLQMYSLAITPGV